jgi:hypothetical protein
MFPAAAIAGNAAFLTVESSPRRSSGIPSVAVPWETDNGHVRSHNGMVAAIVSLFAEVSGARLPCRCATVYLPACLALMGAATCEFSF